MMIHYPPLVAIRLIEWNTLRTYALVHDIEHGTTDLDCYDAHVLDCIQVLTIRPHHVGPSRVGDVRVIYAPDRADGIYASSHQTTHATFPLPPEIHTQLQSLEGQEAVIIRVLDGRHEDVTPEDEAASMSIADATRFFKEFYRTVIGQTLPSHHSRTKHPIT